MSAFGIPVPPARPGEQPDFSSLNLSDLVNPHVPAIDCSAHDTQDASTGLIRVLRDSATLSGPWYNADEPAFSDDALLTTLKKMFALRHYDDVMMRAQRQGKTTFCVQNKGEEAVALGVQAATQKGDMHFPTYRGHGILFGLDYPIVDLMCQCYANTKDPLGGRQLPALVSSRAHGYFTISGNLATQYSNAVGWAMASAIKGETSATIGWIGEGSTAENDFHAATVFASTYRPPIVLVVVNNQWAISTFQGVAAGGRTTFAQHFIGAGIPALRVDGNDFFAVVAAARYSLNRVRAGHGPIGIEIVTYRAGPHSSSDDPSLYRPAEEASQWPLGDPVDRLSTFLIEQGTVTREHLEEVKMDAHREIDEAQKVAESHGTFRDGRLAPTERMFDDVYASMPDHIRRQKEEATS